MINNFYIFLIKKLIEFLSLHINFKNYGKNKIKSRKSG